MDERTEHPWATEKGVTAAKKARKALPVLTPRQADNLARNLERLQSRRSYNKIGGVDEDFDW